MDQERIARPGMWTAESYWNLLREMTLSQYKVRDQSTLLGLAWSFLHPLLFLGVLYLFFRQRVGSAVEFYAVYVLVGVILFAHFSTATTAAMKVLRTMRAITSNVILPKEILVVSSIGANSVELVTSLLVCLLFGWLSGTPVTPTLLLLPVVVVGELLLVTWVGMVLAVGYVFVRDLEHMYQVFLRLLFFMTPIFYTADFLGSSLAQGIVRLNPLAYLLEVGRRIIMQGEFAPLPFLLFMLFNALLCWASLLLFKRFESDFAVYV